MYSLSNICWDWVKTMVLLFAFHFFQGITGNTPVTSVTRPQASDPLLGYGRRSRPALRPAPAGTWCPRSPVRNLQPAHQGSQEQEGLRTLHNSNQKLFTAGREAMAITVTSNSSSDFLVGGNISLSISYDTSQDALIIWSKDNIPLITWFRVVIAQAPAYIGRLNLTRDGSLVLSNSAKDDSGNYTVSVQVTGIGMSSLTFQVKIYDPVTNASVVQSPGAVDESTSAVNLTCSASSGEVTYTWMRDGRSVPGNGSYVTLDGGRTLQINRPNRTHTGNYSCNASNPVDWDSATRVLNVSYTDAPPPLSGGAIAGIVIGSVCGAILLIALIVTLIFCIRKRRKGKKEKNPPGPHKDAIGTISGSTLSPDDPAYFTLNNIMYRSSSISMGSYVMNSGDNAFDHFQNDSPSPPPIQPKPKHATQV